MYLTIASVDKAVFEGEVVSITLPGFDGEMTILSHHEPLISTLKEGTVVVRRSADLRDIQEFPLKRGILEVAQNKATILI